MKKTRIIVVKEEVLEDIKTLFEMINKPEGEFSLDPETYLKNVIKRQMNHAKVGLEIMRKILYE